jgi:hypothetical protein
LFCFEEAQLQLRWNTPFDVVSPSGLHSVRDVLFRFFRDLLSDAKRHIFKTTLWRLQ